MRGTLKSNHLSCLFSKDKLMTDETEGESIKCLVTLYSPIKHFDGKQSEKSGFYINIPNFNVNVNYL